MILNKRVSTDKDNVESLGRSVRNQTKSLEVAKARSTPSVRWQQISTSNSSNVLSTTRTQTITGGEGDPAARPSDLHLDIQKPSTGFPRRADIRATRFVAEVAASPCGNHLAQVWQVGEGVSPTLDAKTTVRILSTEV